MRVQGDSAKHLAVRVRARDRPRNGEETRMDTP